MVERCRAASSAALLLLAMVACAPPGLDPMRSPAAPSAVAPEPDSGPIDPGPMLDPGRGVLTLAPVIERVTGAVVNIATSSRIAVPANPLLQDPFFRRFFGVPDQPRERRVLSAGSGVIVDAANGYVLTNNHLIGNADQILVTLKDGRELPARLIGSDPGTDIALLHVDGAELTALSFGDSENLQVGDLVIAIGNPFGIGQTVTSGIVSALGRRGLGIEGYEDFIQTDASINPGNSGGALVNSKGELVGINTAILGPAGGNVGIGFAVPSNMARAVMDQLVAYGEVRRGRLGVTVQDLTPALAEALDLRSARGAVVTQVEPGSPATRAGLRPGDVIVEINRRPIDNATDLRNLVGLSEVGGALDITFYRDGREQRVSTQVGQLEAGP